MEKKYILTDETYESSDRILHRIQAVRDFGYVKAGDLGGWIETEGNLSHDGLCWVYNKAKVFGNALVCDDAKIYDYAKVYDCSRVNSHAEISDCAQICGHAIVTDKATVRGQAIVRGNSNMYDKSNVSGDAIVSGNARVMKNACVRRNGVILNTFDYLVVGPIGSRDAYTTFYRAKDGILVSCGCFNDSIDAFENRVLREYGYTGHGKNYLSAIRFAREYFKS